MQRIAPLPILSLILALAPAPASAASDDDAVARFAEALRFETVSPADPADFHPEPFVAFRAFLAERFPLVHEHLEHEVVGGHSLLYTWHGTSDAEPILLTSHYDVVPVPDEALGSWEHPPFAGVVADGFVWGRGALDDKVGVLATLEAVERLLGEGFEPTRTIFLAFGHDEEIGGEAGAEAITRRLESRGVRVAWSLDEGMAVISDPVAGMDAPAAMIGVAEKGYVHMEITTHAPGGHSSLPPRQGAIGRLAQAIDRLEANPMRANMETIAGRTLDAMAPHVGGIQGFALRNRRFLGPIVERILATRPATDALLRTTTAVTMVRGGVKPNVLPTSATATVNFRLLPGDTIDAVEDHTRRVIDDPDVDIAIVRGSEASEVSSTDSEGYRALEAAVGEVFPEAVPAPGLVLGGTDSRHYARVADDSYRFGPLELTLEDTRRIHGTNERIAVSNYLEAIDFYATLIRGGAGRAAGSAGPS